METSLKNALKATTIEVKNLKRDEVLRMYELFNEYYIHHDLSQFEQDLFEKDHVILLRDKENQSIQGFSTLVCNPLRKSSKEVIGVFSGDTVVNKNYWGSSVLGLEFLKYLWFLKIKRPGVPVYWFLITKGYKTYLMMAKNFSTFYPRFEEHTPQEYKKLMDDFYSKKFPHLYDPNSGLICHDGESCALKEQVADITPDLLTEPRIKFFQEKNPHWQRGEELTCIAKMTFWMPLKYLLKKLLQVRKR